MRSALLLVVTLAVPAAFAQSPAVLTAEELADLAPLMPRPAGGSDEALASIAPRLVLAVAAERVQLQPAAAVATAGQQVPFTLSMATPSVGQAGPEKFIVEQWRVDGMAGGNARVGSVVVPVAPGAAAGEPVAQAQAVYVAPAQLAATREVTVSAVLRIGQYARHRVEVIARVLLLAGPVAATLTWETRAENLQARAENRGRGASVDNESSSATTRHRVSGALAFTASELQMRELATGRRLELHADAGFAQAQAVFFQRGWRQKKDAWCSEDSSYVQAASGETRRTWPETDRPRLQLQLASGALRAQFSPPTLRLESTLEDASTYVRRCRDGGGTNTDQRDATQRAWTHGATSVGTSTPVLLQQQDDGRWQWAGSLPDPVNTGTFRQDTHYRISVRAK